jgi:3-oxoacyl-[acyl-carrier protein] reductase
MDLHLDGQVVLVTGSSRGIGRGIAEGFLKEGARVVLTGKDLDSLKTAEADFKKRYGQQRVKSFPGDLRQSQVLEELASFMARELGRLDHLVCNLGTGRSVPPLQEDETEWRRLMEINLFSAAAAVRALLPLLEDSVAGGNSAVSIIFIGSICGLEAMGCPVAYAAAKSALLSYAKNIARPLGERGIRVNVVSPGNILFKGSTWEDKLAKDHTAVEAMLRQEVPLQRLGTLTEVTDVVVFLASQRAAFVTGANWVVDGGQTRSF